MKHKIMSAILALIVIGVIASAAGGGGNKPASNNAGKTPATQTATVVEVKAFGDEFEANQVAAESKYKGKLVQFSAPISNITDSGLSFQNVTSKDFSLTQISCGISDKNQLLSLKNGQAVTIKGTVSGQTIGVIGMNDCTLVQ